MGLVFGTDEKSYYKGTSGSESVKFYKKKQQSKVAPRPEEPQEETATQYLISHAEPTESERLEKLSNVPYFTPYWQDTPWKKLHRAAFQIAGEQAYRTLALEEKHEYGYKFTDWEKIPVEERKQYYGASQYFSSLSPTERQKITRSVLIPIKDEYNFPKKGISGLPLLTLSTRGAEHVKSGKTFQEATDITTWEALTKTTPEFKAKTYAGLPMWERIVHSTSQVAVTTTLWPVTLAQTGVKFATGKGEWHDVFGRIETGKTLTGFDVSKELDKVSMGPTGLISTGISEGIGAYTGKGSTAWSTTVKYPIESIIATAGELFGFHVGGTTLKSGFGATYKYTHIGINKLRIKLDQSRFIKDTWATSGIGKPRSLMSLSEWEASMYQKGLIWDYAQGGYTKLGSKAIVQQQLSTVSKRTVSTMTRPKTSLRLYDVYPVYTKPGTGFSLKMQSSLWTNVYTKTLAKTLTYTLAKSLTMTQPVTKTKILTQDLTMTQPVTKTKILTQDLTMTKVQVQPFTATKTQTLTKTQPLTQTLTKTLTLTKLKTKTKVKPKPLFFDFDGGTGRKKKKLKPIDWTKGYRERTHKVLSMKELVGGI